MVVEDQNGRNHYSVGAMVLKLSLITGVGGGCGGCPTLIRGRLHR